MASEGYVHYIKCTLYIVQDRWKLIWGTYINMPSFIRAYFISMILLRIPTAVQPMTAAIPENITPMDYCHIRSQSLLF